jgi:hypothetical protein
MAPDAAWRIPSRALPPVGLGRIYYFTRDDPILENLLVVINVINKKVKRLDALLQPALDPPPFVRSNNPRHDVEGEDFLQAVVFAVNVEGNAHLEQLLFRSLLPVEDLPFRQGLYIRQ